MENSLDVLSESLDMKIKLLNEIEEYNMQQKKSFEDEVPNMDSFDEAIEKKAELIERLEKLDDGFETLYENLAQNLKVNKDKYADKIKSIQNKISIITELSVSVQASEARNKKIIEDYFAKQKSSIAQNRRGSRVAYDYYKNMSGTGLRSSQFMDSKN